MSPEVFDDVIVGSGPCGLTLAWYLSQIPGRRIIVLDEHDATGGCHRVSRSTGSLGTSGLFCEHSPRIYSENYRWFQAFLQDIGLDFDTYFTPYQYGTAEGAAIIADACTIRELLWLGYEFVAHTVRRTMGHRPKTWVVQDFLADRGFSVTAANTLDRFCRLLESAGADRFRMFEFMELLDQTSLHSAFIPAEPTDVRLFPDIVDALRRRGVEIRHSARVEELTATHVAYHRVDTRCVVHASRILLAIPLSAAVSLFDHKTVYCQSLRDRVRLSSYDSYPTIVFHWPKDSVLPPGVWGFPIGPWGIISIRMNPEFETTQILSTTVSMSNGIVDGYTVEAFRRTFSDHAFAAEVFRQLQLGYPHQLPPYMEYAISATSDSGHLHSFAPTPWETPYENVFVIGFHNEVADYPANTAESATETAIRFVQDKHPGQLTIPTPPLISRRLSTAYRYPFHTLSFLARLLPGVLRSLVRSRVRWFWG
jgi:hypothetical protein